MIKNIEFRKVRSNFLTKIANVIKEVRSSEHLLVPADKSRHIYKVNKQDYAKLLKENVTKAYKKDHPHKLSIINKESKIIVNG